MAELKGKVIRVDRKTMIVLTDEGDFLNSAIPPKRPKPGDIVEVRVPPVRHFSAQPWIRAAAVVVVLALSLVIAKPFVLPQAVAAVSMDLSSSIELSVNKGQKVLKVTANNGQGEAVLRDLDLIGLDIYQAADLVTAKAVELGYLDTADDNTVMVTVAPLTRAGMMAVNREKLQQVMHEVLMKQNYDGYLVVNQSAGEISEEAQKMGLTVNQYMVWKLTQSQPQSDQIDVQSIKGEPVSKMIASDEASLNRMFPGMWCRVGREGKGPGASQPGSTQNSSTAPGADSPDLTGTQQGGDPGAALDSSGADGNLQPQNTGFGMRGPGMGGPGPGARFGGPMGPWGEQIPAPETNPE